MEARRLMNKGIEITAVGITESVDENFLRGISSADNYFKVTDFEELGSEREQISRGVCKMTERGKHCVYQETMS